MPRRFCTIAKSASRFSRICLASTPWPARSRTSLLKAASGVPISASIKARAYCSATFPVSPRFQAAYNPSIRKARARALNAFSPSSAKFASKVSSLLSKLVIFQLLAQLIYCPPLIDSVEPVMKLASSAARNTTARAISPGSPRRPTGMRGRMLLAITSGATASSISVWI